MTTNIFFRNIIYIIGYKVASIINSSYYAMLINNNMATGFPPIQSQNATGLLFVYKNDVIGVEVYSLALTQVFPSKDERTSGFFGLCKSCKA